MHCASGLDALPTSVGAYVCSFLDQASYVRYLRTSTLHRRTASRPDASPHTIICGMDAHLRARLQCGIPAHKGRHWQVYHPQDYTRVFTELDDVRGDDWSPVPFADRATIPGYSREPVRDDTQALMQMTRFWGMRPRVLDFGHYVVTPSTLDRVGATFAPLRHLCLDVGGLRTFAPLARLPHLRVLCIYRTNDAISVNVDTRAEVRHVRLPLLAPGLELLGSQTRTLVCPVQLLAAVAMCAPRHLERLVTFERDVLHVSGSFADQEVRDASQLLWSIPHYERLPRMLELVLDHRHQRFNAQRLAWLAAACPLLESLQCGLEKTRAALVPVATIAFGRLRRLSVTGQFDEQLVGALQAPLLDRLHVNVWGLHSVAWYPVAQALPTGATLARQFPTLAYYTVRARRRLGSANQRDGGDDDDVRTLCRHFLAALLHLRHARVAAFRVHPLITFAFPDARPPPPPLPSTSRLDPGEAVGSAGGALSAVAPQLDRLSLVGLAELLPPHELDALLSTVIHLDVRGTGFLPTQMVRAARRLESLCISLLPRYALDTETRLVLCLRPLLRLPTLRRLAIATYYEAGVAERLSELAQTACGRPLTRNTELRLFSGESEAVGMNIYVDGTYFVDRAHLAAFDFGEARPDAGRHCVSKLVSWTHSGPQLAAQFETRTPCDCVKCGDAIDWTPVHVWTHNWLRRRRKHSLLPVAATVPSTSTSSSARISAEISTSPCARFGVLTAVACIAFVVGALTRHFL